MFRNLLAEMAMRGITVFDISKLLNVTEKTVKNKLNGKTDFYWSEVVAIKKSLFATIDVEYLFEVKKKSKKIIYKSL